MSALRHPAVRLWFERRFPGGPTPAQERGWPPIVAGRSTLIAAPTGAGKTLAGFLIAIDELYRAAARGEPVGGATHVVYVSPLRALALDVQQNLEVPLREIAAVAVELGMNPPDLRVEVRSGDTPAAARAAMLRRPPSFLVTTPESLYLLLTSPRSRANLGSVRTVIVDEIHALAADRRGAHLALSLERLEAAAGAPLRRVGLSATQRPVEVVAGLLVGVGEGRVDGAGRPRCAVVDVGHRRPTQLAIELPGEELEAVASAGQLGQVVDRIAAHVLEHRTTLVFVNTRRMSERVAHLLAERLGDGAVAAHHGSLSRERRTLVETRLRAGELRALVATASLELGIDIGPVDLVCQISPPRSIGTLLQRVGRSGHHLGGTAVGRLFPLSRDELVECCALLAAVRRGDLDAIRLPRPPRDVLAQHLIAEAAARGDEGVGEDELYRMARHAAPFSTLTRSGFDEVVELVSEGVETGRGTIAARLHRDRVGGVLRARRGTRLVALTSGGAIPETGDYRVLAEPDETVVGSVTEDWAVESMVGDVFLLGTSSWRILRVGAGTVRVADAQGAPPSVPFWLGEAPGRTAELSDEVSRLRAGVDARLAAGGRDAAVAWLEEGCGVARDVAGQAVDYLAAARSALGLLPTRDHLVLERFFDDSGGMQLVLHAPLGARLNRALGLALRKRFCATFDFELQAAASDDCVLLSLGPQHSLPLEAVPRLLASRSVEDVLRRAVIFAPMFAARWRWNLTRSLVVPRFRGGRRTPPPIQRLEADDVLAALFPALLACQNENPAGPIEIPDHVLVRQTVDDCLHEAMDGDGLRALVEAIELGTVRIACRDTTEPSVLAHEIVNGPPHTFLDDAPLEDRRSRAAPVRRGLTVMPGRLDAVDPQAAARVRAEVRPAPRGAEELHELLLALVVMRPRPEWEGWFEALVAGGRALRVRPGGTLAPSPDTLRAAGGAAPAAAGTLWCARESRPVVEMLDPGARFIPDLPALRGTEWDGGADPAPPAARVLRGHLEASGPVTELDLSRSTALPPRLVAAGLARLEAEGFALRARYGPAGAEGGRWCSRRLLERIHRNAREALRREVSPVTPAEFVRFLLRWQHVAEGGQWEGRAGLRAAITQLQGFEAPAGAWETEILPRRVAHYRPDWLDDLGLSGTVAWARLRVRGEDGSAEGPAGGSASGTCAAVGDGEEARRALRADRSRPFPSRSTPITLVLRSDLPWLLQAVRGRARPLEPAAGATHDVVEVLRHHGALFTSEIGPRTGRLPSEVEAGLWDAVSRGLVAADGFAAVRSLLAARSPARGRRPIGARRGIRAGYAGEGRWSLLPEAGPVEDRDALAEVLAGQLLRRFGVIFWDLAAREPVAVPWRELLWALRRLEARGTVRGGRFVSGVAGEQYALPEAVDALRAMRRGGVRAEEPVVLSAADPLNVTGVVVPGARVPSGATRRLTLGGPAQAADAAPDAAVLAAMPGDPGRG